MQDIVVAQSLRNRGYTIKNVEEALVYEAIERKPRVLDKEPKRLVLNRAKDIQSYGCCNEFIISYQDVKNTAQLKEASVEVMGKVKGCDIEVFWTLKALIAQGVTCIEDKAEACYDLVRTIITTTGNPITKKDMFNILNTYASKSYYVQELIKGIKIAVYNVNLTSLYWVSLCDTNGFYEKALEIGQPIISKNCEKEKDVQKFLNPLYKKAKEDKDFMAKIYKPGANKWMVAMLYHIKDEHPEALEPGNKADGFA